MDKTSKIQSHAPALVALAGIIAGLVLAKQSSAAILPQLLAAVFLGFISWRLALKGRDSLWLPAFLLGVTLAFWAYGTLRLPSAVDDSLLLRPPREAQLELIVERIMQPGNDFGQASGIARVIEANATSQLTDNSRIYFQLSAADSSTLNIAQGMQLMATGVLHPIHPDVPADSFQGYLRAIGVHYRFDRTSEAIELQPAPLFRRLCNQIHLRFQDFLRLGEPEDRGLSRIYIAMLLGLKTELTPEQSDRFRMTGTMHLFAISGLHIGVVATVVAQALLLVRVPRSLRPLIGLPLVYLYVEITGAAPSAIRAFLMVTFFWASIALERQRSPLAALVASAVCVLIIQPAQLWQMGFQLSYLVVLSILLFGLPLHEALWLNLRPYKYLPESGWSTTQHFVFWFSDKVLLLFSISLSAWLASAPLSAGFFGFIAPFAVLINMLLVNLATLVISGGVISLALASVSLTDLSAFLNHAAWLGISLMDGLVRLNISLPGAIISSADFPRFMSYTGVALYFGSLFLTSTSNRLTVKYLLPTSLVVLCLLAGQLIA